jgi:hypothetical protein
MAADQAPDLSVLLELDGRHDDLLERLDSLDKSVARVLAECQTLRQQPVTPAAGPTSPTC